MCMFILSIKVVSKPEAHPEDAAEYANPNNASTKILIWVMEKTISYSQ